MTANETEMNRLHSLNKHKHRPQLQSESWDSIILTNANPTLDHYSQDPYNFKSHDSANLLLLPNEAGQDKCLLDHFHLKIDIPLERSF